MWLSLASDPATASFSHTISVLQQCLKHNRDLLTAITSHKSNLSEDLHNRLDEAHLQNERAAALVKLQARTFSYRALMGSAPGSEHALALIHKVEALNALTGDNITLTDVQKLRALMKSESAVKQTVQIRSSSATRILSPYINTPPDPLSTLSEPPLTTRILGQCYLCCEYA